MQLQIFHIPFYSLSHFLILGLAIWFGPVLTVNSNIYTKNIVNYKSTRQGYNIWCTFRTSKIPAVMPKVWKMHSISVPHQTLLATSYPRSDIRLLLFWIQLHKSTSTVIFTQNANDNKEKLIHWINKLLTCPGYSRNFWVIHVQKVWCCCWPCHPAHPWTSADSCGPMWSWHSPVHSPQCCGLHPAPRSGLPGWSPSGEERQWKRGWRTE